MSLFWERSREITEFERDYKQRFVVLKPARKFRFRYGVAIGWMLYLIAYALLVIKIYDWLRP